MDKLRQLVSNKKRESESEFQGRKYVRRTELESARLKRVREQEEEEQNRKVRAVYIAWIVILIDYGLIFDHTKHCRRL